MNFMAGRLKFKKYKVSFQEKEEKIHKKGTVPFLRFH